MFWKILLKILEAIFTYILVFVATLIIIPFIVLGMIIYLPIDAASEVWSDKLW